LAEFSVAVLDAYQGMGLARILIAVLLFACRSEGLDVLEAHTLSENRPVHRLMHAIGAKPGGSDAAVTLFRVDVQHAIDMLRMDQDVEGLAAVYACFE